jgi:hypothetical protein
MGQVISSKGSINPGAPGMHALGMPESAGVPAFQFFTPEDLKDLKSLTPEAAEDYVRIIDKAIKSAFDRYSIYTQAKPFDNYDLNMVPLLAGVPARLDAFAQRGQIGRRALLICNTSGVAANVLWVGKANIAVGLGLPCVANNGTVLISVHERAEHWGVCAAGINVVVVWYS